MLFGIVKKERRPVKWVLKAKPPESDSWEDIESYSEEKTYADLKDTIDELREQGYEGIRLDAYDKDNRFVRHVFVRYFGLNRQVSQIKGVQKSFNEIMSSQMMLFNEMLKTQTELIKSMSELKKQMTESNPTFIDGISQFLYFKELEKQLYESLGISPNQVKTNPMVEKLVYEVIFDMIRKYMPDIEKKVKEKLASTPQSEQSSELQTLNVVPLVKPKPPSSDIKVPEEITQKIVDIVNKVEEKVAPPCMKGGEKCLEGEA